MSNRQSKKNPRYKNGARRRNQRARFKAMGLPCAICNRPIDYDAPSNADHPYSFVIDEIFPVSRWEEFGYNSPEAAAQDWNNVQPVHYCCNAKKGARTMAELQKKKAVGTWAPDGQW